MTDDADRNEGSGGDRIHWDQDLSYGQYLDLDKLLTAQNPLTEEHDEMLFIIIHQATELWLKLCLHELSAAHRQIQQNDLRPAFKMLSRVARIQAQLLQSWEVLSTLTPTDYLKFRDRLGQSSGFQSLQYRRLEYMLGNRNARLAEAHRARPEDYKTLRDALKKPSLYDECLKLLHRRGFDIPPDRLQRDWAEAYQASDEVEQAWQDIYTNPEKHWDLYELAEKLVDLEQHFQEWRFVHLKTVERIIGHKRGTGGSSGVDYLAKALGHYFFPELWSARTHLT